MARDTSTLRDILFDELDDLRSGRGDPKRAQAVAKPAQQIISTAKVEMDFHKLQVKADEKGKALVMGSMDLGHRAVPAVSQSPQQEIEHIEQDQALAESSKPCME